MEPWKSEGEEGDYFQVAWDSGLVNEAILGYHRHILRPVVE